MKLTSINEIKSLMSRHNMTFSKGYGQNFLVNESVPGRIAGQCGAEPDDGILEIGPGIGTLTSELAERYADVVAVEIDARLLPILDETLGRYDNVTVIHGDILKTPLAGIAEKYFPGREITVCANLPYYITSPILMYLLESGVKFRAITVMVQKEVARRLTASPGTPDYGALTASVNRYGTAERLFDVSPGSFLPAPKVDSSVVRITPYEEGPYRVRNERTLGRVIRGSFALRRKNLANSLSSEFGEIKKDDIIRLLSGLGFETGVRGEELGIREFALVSDAIDGFTNGEET
ncbi:MAG: 16S rRNA (adenine(1518)-N(6)/adenine(1519)-N(6))-dimethyltransferase RsmA [Clostridia bacterium]|nr:16S rRNA (adenine(1518)-N(6)/adenine(1519)-N(6))-dimethyltransferase RsmA [Clostridia bacterium]